MAKKQRSTKITQCPECGTNELLVLDGDCICHKCDWNSAKMSVERGEFDNIFVLANQTQGKVTPSLVPLCPSETGTETNMKNIDGGAA